VSPSAAAAIADGPEDVGQGDSAVREAIVAVGLVPVDQEAPEAIGGPIRGGRDLVDPADQGPVNRGLHTQEGRVRTAHVGTARVAPAGREETTVDRAVADPRTTVGGTNGPRHTRPPSRLT
jgi:hypothetical protein